MKSIYSIVPACILIVSSIEVVYPAESSALDDPWSNLYKIQTVVSNRLVSFGKDHDVRHLNSAFRLASRYAPTTNRFRFDVNAKIRRTELVLLVVERAFKAQNPEFDFSDRPASTVFPPRETGLLPAPVDPQTIKDPEARALYEKAIKANNEKNAKYERELQLRRIVERGLEECRTFFIRTPLNAKSRTRALQTFTNTIRSSKLLELLIHKLRKENGVANKR